MKKHIPNLITSLNVISGTFSVFAALYGHYEWAVGLILAAMVFDFFDGLAARLLHVKSEMGKELDSLADVVSFGVAPAVLAHFLMRFSLLGIAGENLEDLPVGWQALTFVPVLIPAFSAYRLAKFNLDIRQTVSFIGMPTPANALFWLGLTWGFFHMPEWYSVLFGNVWTLAVCVVILSVLLISELPMFSLKISGFGWKGNQIRYTYFLVLFVLVLILGKAVILFIIPLYLLFSVVEALLKMNTATRSDR